MSVEGMDDKEAARLVAINLRPDYPQMVVGRAEKHSDHYTVAFEEGSDGYVAEVRGREPEDVVVVSGPAE